MNTYTANYTATCSPSETSVIPPHTPLAEGIEEGRGEERKEGGVRRKGEGRKEESDAYVVKPCIPGGDTKPHPLY